MTTMTLTEYLETENLSPAAFAARLEDASEGAVRKWMTGERMPKRPQMIEIYRVTNGLVTPNDFHGVGYVLSRAEDRNPKEG